MPIFGRPLVPAINLSAAYEFDDIAALKDYYSNKLKSVRYSRDSSSLSLQLESYFSAMHGGKPCNLFQSGMAAIAACIGSARQSIDVLASVGSIYRKTSTLLEQTAAARSIDARNYAHINELLAGLTKYSHPLIILESPSNPFLSLFDVRDIRRSFENAFIIIDTTLQGLLNDKLSIYNVADLIVTSCTKYIGGHNDLLGGFVISRDDSVHELIWEHRSTYGGLIDNLSAYLLFRSLRTYDVRINNQVSNAERVLEHLNNNSSVREIYYPGKYENFSQSNLLEEMHFHGGSVITFRVAQSVRLEENIEKLLSTKMAPSFGSIDSLIEVPAYMSHWGKTNEQLRCLGLDYRTVRLSVGLEPVELLIDDIQQLTTT